MKLKKFLSALVSGAMILGTMAAVPVFADEVTTVSPNWDGNTTATVYAYGTNASGDFELYADTLADALKQVYMNEPTGTTTIECKPGENVGSMTHAHVADNLIINGNGAYVSGGECDLEIDTYTYDRATGTDTGSTAPELSGDITVEVNQLKHIAAWGQRRSDFTINLEFTGCQDMNRVYFSGNKGTTNITIKNCSFSDATGGSSSNTSIYSNAKGEINLDNVSFKNVAVPINLRNKSNGTQTIIVKNCQFTNCATAEIANNTSSTLYAAPIRVVTEGSAIASNVTVENCSFTGCATAGNGTILLGDGRDGENSTPNVTLNISGTAAEIQVQEPGKRTTPTVEQSVTAADNKVVEMPAIAKINDKKYSTLKDAIAAAQDGDTVKVLEDITLTNNILMTTNKAITLDLNDKTLSCEGGRIMLNGADMTVTGNGTIKAVLWEEENESKGSQTAIEVLDADSTLTVDSVNVRAGANNMIFAAGNSGSIIINGGTYTVTDGGTCFYVFDNSKLTINNGIFNGTGNEGTGIVWAFNGSDVKVYNGTFNVENDTTDYGIESNVNWALCDYRELIGFPFSDSLAVNSKGNIQVYGGKFNRNPNMMPNLKWELISAQNIKFHPLVVDYVAPGYVSTKNADGTYTVAQSEATVIDTAKTTGATVTLDNLTKNAAIDHEPDATYKVVVSTPSAADADAANKAIEDASKYPVNPDTNTSKAMFDISVVKVDSNGVETDLGGTGDNSIKNQPVTLTLGDTPDRTKPVYVYHVDDNGVATQITTPITVTGNKITFTAPSFSTYAVSYTAAPAAEGTITDEVGVVFSPVSQGSNQYYITLKSLKADKKINRFMSTDLVFVNKCSTVDYDITPAANMTASVVSEKVDTVNNTNSREYRFNMDGKTFSSATGTGITIGTITFYGYGTLDFSIDTGYASGHAINIVNTATATNNIVASYTLTGGLFVNDDVTGNTQLAGDEKGKITDTLVPETKDLTVKIAYNNAINDNVAAYQDMTVTISGGDLDEPLTVELGTDPKFSESFANRNAQNEVISTVTFADNTYVLNIKGELTMNCSYTVTVSGAGYRTARYTVNMKTDKELNFWNNVMDNKENIETGVGTPSKTNFLAGDIVKDNQINIYDLSAVVSYFGTSNNVNAESAYAKYDLNRDGKIDSKDVAYVLVSWNN